MKSLKFCMLFRVCLEESRLPLARLEQRICSLPSAMALSLPVFPKLSSADFQQRIDVTFLRGLAFYWEGKPLHQAPIWAKHPARCVTCFSHLILTINYTK